MNQPEQNTPGPQPAPAQRNPMLELFLMAVLFCIVASVSIAVTWKLRSVRAKKPQPAPIMAPPSLGDTPRIVPNFSLIDKDGKSVALDDLKGQVWVANFFFTSCSAQCPMMNTRMAQIQRALPEGAAAKLVSITVDPEKDSPEVLAEYAKTFHAKDGRWLFLTGDKQAIIRLAREGFMLPAGDNPNDHSLRLALVDRDGRIRGYFNSTDDDSVAQLQQELLALLEAK